MILGKLSAASPEVEEVECYISGVFSSPDVGNTSTVYLVIILIAIETMACREVVPTLHIQ